MDRCTVRYNDRVRGWRAGRTGASAFRDCVWLTAQPTKSSEAKIAKARTGRWRGIDLALRHGYRGLRRGEGP